MSTKSIKCSICDSFNVLLIKSIDTDQLILAWKQNFNIDISSEFKEIRSVDLFKCDLCSFQFFLPFSLEGSSYIYKELQNLSWYYMPRKWEYNLALKELKGCRTIMEIGCGSGEFIKLARVEKELNVEGLELNEKAVLEAQKHDLPVKNLDLREAAVQFPGHYDAVCSFQVLEHVSNPNDFLEWSCALIKPGGKLILGLPNANSFLKYQFNVLDMPPHHMSRWSSKVLCHLQSLFPLKLKHIKLEPLAEYHVDCYINTYWPILAKIGFTQYFCQSSLKRWLSKSIKRTRLRKLLRGQSLFVSFIRV